MPLFVHGAIEYAAGVLFIGAPLLFQFDAGPATALSVVVGILVLFVAATTDSPTGLVRGMTLTVHVVLDYVLAMFLIAAPFLFDFTDDTSAIVFFIVMGIVHLLLTVATRFLRGPATPPVKGA